MCAGSGLYHSTNDTGRKTRRSRPFLARFTVCWATGRYLSGGGVGISEMTEPEKVPTAAKPDNLSLVPGPLYGGRRGPDSCQLSFDLHPRVMRQPPTNFFKKRRNPCPSMAAPHSGVCCAWIAGMSGSQPGDLHFGCQGEGMSGLWGGAGSGEGLRCGGGEQGLPGSSSKDHWTV